MMQRQWIAAAPLAAVLLGVVSAHAAGRPDHLMCYKMTDTLQIEAAVDMIADLQPQYSQRGCTLVKPAEFCVPATKQNVQPPPTANDLTGQPLRQDYICYLAKCANTALTPPVQVLADQFGVRRAGKFKATKVCVPATKLPVLCGAPGSRQCSGACPTDQACVASPNGCTCQPEQCGGAPDKAGMCGGDCPPDEICRLAVTTSGKPTCTCQQQPPPPCGANPLTGSCGGDCTDPTLKCLPNGNGGCDCRQPPTLCSAVVGGQCGGECPNPDDQCVTSGDAANPCICEPKPCHQNPLNGACSGTCDAAAGPGALCHLDDSNSCTCGPPPCGIDPATGTCGGTCPPGEECAVDAANDCTCTLPCRQVDQNVCGGACPPGLTCKVQGQDCTCVAPPACAFGTGTAGVCGGACPAGQTCGTRKTPSGGVACLCLDQ